MFAQLDRTIPCHMLGMGDNFANGMFPCGQEHKRIGAIALAASGAIWGAPYPRVRLGRSSTMGRKDNPEVAAEKAASRTR